MRKKILSILLISLMLIPTVSLLIPFATSTLTMDDTDLGWNVDVDEFIGYQVNTTYFLFNTVNYLGFNVLSNTTDSGEYTLNLDGIIWNITTVGYSIENQFQLSYEYDSNDNTYTHQFVIDMYFPIYPIIIVPINLTDGDSYDLDNIAQIYEDNGLWDGYESDATTLNFTDSIYGSYCNMTFDAYGVLDSAILSIVMSVGGSMGDIVYAQTYARIIDPSLLNTIDDTDYDMTKSPIFKNTMMDIPISYYKYDILDLDAIQYGLSEGVTCLNPMVKAIGIEYIWNVSSDSWESTVDPWVGNGDNYTVAISNNNFNSISMRGDFNANYVVDSIDGDTAVFIVDDVVGEDGDLIGYSFIVNDTEEYTGVIYAHENNGTTNMNLSVEFDTLPTDLEVSGEGTCSIPQSDDSMKIISTLYKIGTNGYDLYSQYQGIAQYFGVFDGTYEIGSNYTLFENASSGAFMYIEVDEKGWLANATIYIDFGGSGMATISYIQISQEDFDHRDDPAYNVEWGVDVGDSLFYNVSSSNNPDYDDTFSRYVVSSIEVQGVPAFGDMEILASVVNATHYQLVEGYGWNETGDQWSEETESNVVLGSQRTDRILFMRNGPANLLYGIGTTGELFDESVFTLLSEFSDLNASEYGDNWVHMYNTENGHFANITWNENGIVTLLEYDFDIGGAGNVYSKVELMDLVSPVITKEYLDVYGWLMVFNFTIVMDGITNGTLSLGNRVIEFDETSGFDDFNINIDDNLDGSWSLTGLYVYNNTQSYDIEINIIDDFYLTSSYSDSIETFNLVDSLEWGVNIGDYLVYNITNGTNWYGRYQIMNVGITEMMNIDVIGLNATHNRWIDSEWVLTPDYIGSSVYDYRFVSGNTLGMIFFASMTMVIPIGFTGYDYAMIYTLMAKASGFDIVIHSYTDNSVNMTLMDIMDIIYEWNEDGIVTYSYTPFDSVIEIEYIDVPSIISSGDLEYVNNTTGNEINWTVEPVYVFGDNATYEVLLDGESYIDLSNLTEDGLIAIDVDGYEIGEYEFTILVYDGSGRIVESTIIVSVLEYVPPEEPTGLTMSEIALIIAGLIGGAVVVIYLSLRKKKGVNVKGIQGFNPDICKMHPELPECRKFLNK